MTQKLGILTLTPEQVLGLLQIPDAPRVRAVAIARDGYGVELTLEGDAMPECEEGSRPEPVSVVMMRERVLKLRARWAHLPDQSWDVR
jgi:hypothetical protein